MRSTITFKSDKWRVQLGVSDYTDVKSIMKNLPTRFWFARLAADTPKSQSFSTGATGNLTVDLTSVLMQVQSHIRRNPLPELPQSWLKRYGALIDQHKLLRQRVNLKIETGRASASDAQGEGQA